MKQISLLLAAAAVLFLPMRSLAIGPGAPPTNVPALLNTWTFENTTNWLTTESASLPMSASNVFASDLGDHYAVIIDYTNAAWLQYPVIEFGGRTNLSVSKGTVCLWFAPSWASGNGPGDWGALIHAGRYTTNASWGYWSIYCDPHGTNLYFSVQTNGAEATYLSAPISWTTNYWHFLALTYSSTNTTLYLDGMAVTNGGGLTYLPGADSLTNGFFIGSDEEGTEQAKGRFDDIFTYDAPLDDGSVAALFNIFSIIYFGNPENPANFVSAPSTVSYDPVFNAITGAGYLQEVSTNSSSCLTSSNVWFTNMTASIIGTQGVTVTFSIAGGSNGLKYDVFGSPGLASPFTNASWVWLGQANHCTTYQITNLPRSGAVLVLGKPTDSDADGLTDAYEALIGHSDPQNPYSDGSGLPDWWQIVHFGHLGVDPYDDPDHDGYTNLEEMRLGTDPFAFTSPPKSPLNVSARLDATGSNVIVSWNSVGGAVVQYAVEATEYFGGPASTPLVSSTTFSLTNYVPYDFGSHDNGPSYRVRADFSNGASSYSEYVSVYSQALSEPWGWLLASGTNGEVYLALPGFPASAHWVRFYSALTSGPLVDVAVTNLTNGVLKIPATVVPILEGASSWTCRLFGENGQIGTPFAVSAQNAEESVHGPALRTNFVNAARQMKENLVFLLRSATVTAPFSYSSDFWDDDQGDYLWRQPTSTDYEYYGFHTYNAGAGYSQANYVRPIEENFLFCNFAFNTADITNGLFETGQNWNFYSGDGYRELDSAKYVYTGRGEEVPLPLALAASNSQWLVYPDFIPDFADAALDVGLSRDGSGYLSLSSGAYNAYGLSFLSSHYVPTTSSSYTTLNAGSTGDPFEESFFMETALPGLHLEGFYFASQTPHFDYGGSAQPLPGSPEFSPTNTSPLLIAAMGWPINVSGWAKYSLTNGYLGKYGYLEQYWDKAYKVNPDGSVSTNETGLLSPYGDFFPTQPGRVALVTMPEIMSGQRGTATVYVVQLAVDGNHDGMMDTGFGEPNSQYANKPFKFWLNNDDDGTGVGKDSAIVTNVAKMDYSDGTIRSRRDLEDFARLWVLGLPKLPSSDGYRATLSMSPITGSPGINLYAAFTNSADYLKSTNGAAQQFTRYELNGEVLLDFAKKLSTVDSVQAFSLPKDGDGVPLYTNFLFEGEGVAGTARLVLTIFKATPDTTNTILRAFVTIDLHDIKDFYERTIITNNVSGTPSNWISSIQSVTPATASGLGGDTNILVLVHGVNVPYPDWEIETDTVFKRLYWAGFRGKFAGVKWPCEFFSAWTALTFDTSVFNRSEMKAYKAGSSLKAYLSQLRQRFSDHRLHLLAHSQGNGVASEAIEAGAPFDTYIMTEAALPASSFDVQSPTNMVLASMETNAPTPEWRPMGYRGIYTNMTGRIVNFFNTNDPVLGVWLEDQGEGKPDGFTKHVLWEATHSIIPPPASWYDFDGTNGWYNSVGLSSSYRVTDPQESRAFISRSRTQPIGRGPPESAHGVITSGVDLHVRYGFDNVFPDDHSAQWAWPIQTTLEYFRQVLTSCQIQPAP